MTPPGQVANSAAEYRDPLQRLAFHFGILLIFLRFSMLHEAMTVLLGTNLYLLYAFGAPALLGVLFSGGLRRVFRYRTAWYWTAFLLWLGLAVPFSVWKGDSARLFAAYARSEFPMLLIIAGLAVNWADCRRILHTLAASAVAYIVMARLFLREQGNRPVLAFGTTANSNDLAAHQILLLPFLLFLVLDSRKPKILRLGGLFAAGLSLQMILRTGSRGALVALTAVLLLSLLMGTLRFRMAMLVTGIAAALAFPLLVPPETRQRLLSLTSETDAPQEAVESLMQRKNLLEKGVDLAFENPIFGSGPGQFTVAEDIVSREQGARRGAWMNVHSVYVQIGAECGIPALVFFLAGLLSSFQLLRKNYAGLRTDESRQQMAAGGFCILLSLTGFAVAQAFLNMAYSYCFPAMAGLAVAACNATSFEQGKAQSQIPNMDENAQSSDSLSRTYSFTQSLPLRPRTER